MKNHMLAIVASTLLYSQSYALANDTQADVTQIEKPAYKTGLERYDHYKLGMEKKYMEKLIELMPTDEEANSLQRQDPTQWVIFGLEICKNLSAGADEEKQRANGADFFGPSLGHALVDAAKTVVCPSEQ